MPKWKGKTVSKAHYDALRRNVEFRLVSGRYIYSNGEYVGGNKNGILIRRGMYK